MIDGKKLEQLARQITESIPPGVREAADNLEGRVKQSLQQQLGKLDVVTREELQIQQQMVLHLRQRIDELEKKIEELSQSKS